MTGKYYFSGALLTGAVLLATILAYPHLPASIPTHWDIYNQPNGFSPKWSLFLIGPGSMIGTMLLMRLLPWLSPKDFEVDSFQPTYLRIMLMIVGFLAYILAVILWAGLGNPINPGRAGIFGVCILFVLMGNVMGKIRRNFYVGVRTPWALSSDRVWNSTHRLAAKTMVLGGLAGVALIALGLDGWAVFLALTVGILPPVLYSLYFYKQLERNGEL